jgi:hypothetical protein
MALCVISHKYFSEKNRYKIIYSTKTKKRLTRLYKSVLGEAKIYQFTYCRKSQFKQLIEKLDHFENNYNWYEIPIGNLLAMVSKFFESGEIDSDADSGPESDRLSLSESDD